MRLESTGVTWGSRKIICFCAGVGFLLAPALSRAQVLPAYTISTIAGTAGTPGYSGDGGPATAAQLSGPCALAVDNSGNLYIADSVNYRVRKMAIGGNINTILGTGTAGDTSGTATAALIRNACGLFLDGSGNLWVSDTTNHEVKKLVTAGTISTIAGDGTGGFSGDNNPAINGELDNPLGIVVDTGGNLYIADSSNNRIRKVGTNGILSTIAGDGTANYLGDGGGGGSAEFSNPAGMAMDANGNLYIADSDNGVIREFSATGVVSTVAGTGINGFSGDGGPATKAQLNGPRDVAIDALGNLYIADKGNSRIRMVMTNGTILTIAGTGTPGFSGDGGSSKQAQLNFPVAVRVDNAGNVYIADSGNSVIRMLTPAPGVLQTPPAVTGVISSSLFGALHVVAPGSWIEITGTNLAADSRLWTLADFHGVDAPTVLDGTSVSIGGQAAFLSAISPTQVNVQIPSNVGPGVQPLTITTSAGTSAAFNITVSTAAPALYAAPNLQVGGKQYTASFNSPPLTFVLPAGVIPTVTSQAARSGDIIVVYGVGFGPVTPTINAGQVVRSLNTLTLPVQFSIGGIPATVLYAGLAPFNIGLYQFDLVVPNAAAGDAVPLTFTLNGVNSTQALYVAVQ